VCRECDRRARSYVLKYSPDQPRVAAGHSDGGQWTSDGGADPEEDALHSSTTGNGNSKPGAQYAPIDIGTRTDAIAGVSGVSGVQEVQAGRPGYPIDLSEEEQLGGHAISQHVGKRPSYLLSLINDDEVLAERHGDLAQGLKEGSFPSLEAANKLVNSTVSKNQGTADLVAQGLLPGAQLDASFASPTGYEAYAKTERSTPYIRDTYGVRVFIVSDKNADKGYRILTAFPMNF
jgi:hypothetical protein